MRRGRQIVAGLVIFGVIAGFSYWFINRDKPKLNQYLTAAVTSEQIVNTVSTTGSIVDQYTYLVNSEGDLSLTQISGVATSSGGFPSEPLDDWKIKDILAKEGSVVARGAPIIVLENFDKSTKRIVAPRRGEILAINSLPQLSVTGNLFTIGSGRKLLSVSVKEGDLVKFTNSQRAIIDGDFPGKVVYVSTSATTNVEGDSAYQVLIAPESGEFQNSIKSGMTAQVEFLIEKEINPKYSTAKFIYEYEFEVDINNELTLSAKNGQLVPITTSSINNKDSWTVESLNVQLGDYLNAGDAIATLRNFDGTTKTVEAKEPGFVRDVFTAPQALLTGALIEIGVGPILAVVEVSEFDIGQVQIGQNASFSTNDQNEVFDAEVIAISSKAIADTSAVAKFKVYLEPVQTSANFRIGSSVRANIILQSINASKAVPVQALKQVNGAYTVEIIDQNGLAITRKVQVGVIGDEFAEIISGLDLAEELIIGSRAPQEVLPTQPTGPFGEGGNNSDDDDSSAEE